jgi:carbon dioxide concentrating mechanism protein CcmO
MDNPASGIAAVRSRSLIQECGALSEAFGVLETTGWTPAMVALDAMEKAATITLWQVELNDFLGTCIKIRGSVDAVRAAIDAGYAVAERMQGRPTCTVIPALSSGGQRGIDSPVEFNVLIQQNVVKQPGMAAGPDELAAQDTAQDSAQDTAQEQLNDKESAVASSNPQALGFIETQGFTAVFEAIDTACKAAQVEVVGKEKLGGGYVTIVIRGDVAAVHAAIDAARPRVDGLGKLIAAHVIPRPSESVLGLLPK